MFPDDQTLIARGKYSTLNREWHEQVKRVQDTCRTIQGAVPLILSDCQEKPPADAAPLLLIGKCLENLGKARERLITLSIGMAEVHPDAWGKEQEKA